MTKIEAKIVAHSISPRGEELITYELVFPRFLLAELNTHRMFSKNSASSRAIPFKKMVEMVDNDPFVPIAWQKEHKGMQGSEYLDKQYSFECEQQWLNAKDDALKQADILSGYGATKQLCNRLLEPFMWHKVLLTTGKEGLQNFFSLRCSQYEIFNDNNELVIFKSIKDAMNNCENPNQSNEYWRSVNKGQAEIHMMELAESMYDTYNESVPQKLEAGDWHIPYCEELLDLAAGKGFTYQYIIKASTGMCARTSYLTVGDDKSPSIETLIGIHDKMAEAVPFHASPFEHCAKVMTDDEYYLYSRGKDGSATHEHGWCRNYKAFIQYRELIETK
jgi:hypothetical protein